MITQEEIKALAELARIDITPEEVESFRKDLGNILDYVSELKEAPVSDDTIHRNLNDNQMRNDDNPHERGLYTKKLLDEAHEVSDKNLIRVKKVIEK